MMNVKQKAVWVLEPVWRYEDIEPIFDKNFILIVHSLISSLLIVQS